MNSVTRSYLWWGAVILAVLGTFLTMSLASVVSGDSTDTELNNPRAVDTATVPAPGPTPSPTSQLNVRRFLPMVLNSRPPDVELLAAWTSNPAGGAQQAFLPGDPMQFRSEGVVNGVPSLDAHLQWMESGPCGSGQVFSDTVALISGDWEHAVSETAPQCTGIYSSTAHLSYGSLIYDHNTKYVVNENDSTIQLSVGHGFDRCYLPSVEDMQAWMDESPYSVFNLYIGGISFACKNDPVDAVWIYETAQQGWAYTLTWVGPQAPCTNFTHRMSSNPNIAYTQGRDEAEEAHAAAISLGFQANKVIYYDLEGYPGANEGCRDAVHEFMRGWVERLHELGTGAGGYGGACSSFISEWAEIQPPPDDVWIAHWYRSQYDPAASVWKAPCVSDGLWVNSQRTKQYTGGHGEIWGGERLVIDSNKFEGKTVVIPGGLGEHKGNKNAVVESAGPVFQSVGLVAPGRGWAVVDERLYWSVDRGAGWVDITPAQLTDGRILGAEFSDENRGMVVGQVAATPAEAENTAIEVWVTADGGSTWRSSLVADLTPQEAHAVHEAYLETIGTEHVWIVLKLQSGSSFSLGRLFASRDGGANWEERSAPSGERVIFLDSERGWMVSGPAYDGLFQTQDGGWTWQRMDGFSPGERATVGMPWFDGTGSGWLPVLGRGDAVEELRLYSSRDGGETWELDRRYAEPESTSLREALLESKDAWMGAAVDSLLDRFDFPRGAYWVDFAGDRYGWAVTHQGECRDEPSNGLEASVKRCTSQNQLLVSEDGGSTWNFVCSAGLPCTEDFILSDDGE